jgi:hypothetical protein
VSSLLRPKAKPGDEEAWNEGRGRSDPSVGDTSGETFERVISLLHLDPKQIDHFTCLRVNMACSRAASPRKVLAGGDS